MPLFNTVTGRGETENVFKANPGKGLPKRTFKDKLTIGSGADQINLYYFGPAHTGGDAFVEFAALRVMHAGDAFARKGRADDRQATTAARALQFAATIRKAVDGVKNVDTIINGHTPAQTTPAEMREFADFVSDFVAHVQAAKKAGKTAGRGRQDVDRRRRSTRTTRAGRGAGHGVGAGDFRRNANRQVTKDRIRQSGITADPFR